MFSYLRFVLALGLVGLVNSMPHYVNHPPVHHRSFAARLANRAVQSDLHVQNVKAAQALNAKFKTLSADAACTEGEVVCLGKDFALCDHGSYVRMSCGLSMQCYALPSVNSVGTTVTCDTEEDAFVRLGSTGSNPAQTDSSTSTSASETTSSSTIAQTPTTTSHATTSTHTPTQTPTTISSSTPSPTTTSHTTETPAHTSSTTTKTPVHTEPTTTKHSTTPQSSPTGVAGGLAVLHGIQTGQATYYNTGLTACGITNNDNQAIVAVSHILFDEYPGYAGGNPNNNPICNKQVRATYQGRTVTAAITDRCEACAETDLDFTPSLFKQLTGGSLDAGRLFGMTWEWV